MEHYEHARPVLLEISLIGYNKERRVYDTR